MNSLMGMLVAFPAEESTLGLMTAPPPNPSPNVLAPPLPGTKAQMLLLLGRI